MRISDLHRRILAGKKDELLLDLYPNASAAYSLRKLRNAYTGNCIEVRRSSDNTTQNIGFVNNVLDTASLLSFVGAGNAFVRTWYDQSASGRNATQTQNANQPQIVSSGAILTFNNKPNVLLNGTSHTMQGPSIFNNVGYGNIFAVHKQTDQLATEAVVIQQRVNSLFASKTSLVYRNAAAGNTGVAVAGRRVVTDSFQAVGTGAWSGNELLSTSFFKWQEAQLESYVNSASNGSRVFQTAGLADTNTNFFTIGSTATPDLFFNGTIKEIIMYESDQSANRTAIESNINSFYNIY
jgi:hypothetical protein